NFGAFAAECHSIDVATAARVTELIKGDGWLWQSFGKTLYNHTLPPGDHSCTNGSFIWEGAWTAGSNHGDGAGILFLDGHVTSLKNSVTPPVWHAIGTMNGRETAGRNDL